MNQTSRIDKETSVADLLREFPQTIPVFLKHQMACVGCSMSAFETVQSAACVYGIAPDGFLRELEQAVSPENQV